VLIAGPNLIIDRRIALRELWPGEVLPPRFGIGCPGIDLTTLS